jgi:flagellar assembly factor FliW
MQAKQLQFAEKEAKNQIKCVKIHNRFGEIEVNPKNKILFPHGLIGLSDARSFVLTEHNIKELKSFKLLQSLEKDEVALLVLALEKENPLFNIEDIYEACSATGYAPEDLVLLTIASTRKNSEGKKEITINLRAPILIDAKHFLATQFVLKNEAYAMQMPFTEVLKYFIPYTQ